MRSPTSRTPRTIIRTWLSAITTAMSLSRPIPSADCRRTILFARRNSIGSEKLRHVADQPQSALRQPALDEGQLADGIQSRAAHTDGGRIRIREQALDPVQGARGHQVLAAPPALIAAQKFVLAEVPARSRLPEEI